MSALEKAKIIFANIYFNHDGDIQRVLTGSIGGNDVAKRQKQKWEQLVDEINALCGTVLTVKGLKAMKDYMTKGDGKDHRSVSEFKLQYQQSTIKDQGSRSRITDLTYASRITTDLAETSRSTSDLDHVLDLWIRNRIPALNKPYESQ
ncbi:hypothetical protein Pmar_PMAR002224 [Perkinsus marinus ATCC 50983]|uniref:Uncharacterized protein n=1 Tax=Perkinsus marinus (strain ATCC 50983 / TXsc) TaxID=423536 RepID=C5L8Z7_PERM5|nr:hypothetical protein Pmar_PMAR002224 [Perkinsus marinus ATCC 50983]EER06855.1 hypothetical protein Pmar_PMAR002224 [Perkinsus marinus ATCC 50983]|eukprot:XP_002775039.1 hypothetical protein Pmar_PMAR002224 [Perkinsus marinus ATCC 50983]